jgi:formamidopyrimidine-DNA glycosylase
METDVAPDQQGVGGQDRHEQPTSEAVEGQVPQRIGRSKAHHRAAVYTSADGRCPRCGKPMQACVRTG